LYGSTPSRNGPFSGRVRAIQRRRTPPAPRAPGHRVCQTL